MQRRKTTKSELRKRKQDRVDPMAELRQLKEEQLRAVTGGRSEYEGDYSC